MRRGGKAVLFLLALLIALSGLALWRKNDLWHLFGGRREPVEISQETAVIAEEKISRLIEDREEVQLSGLEVSSLLRYRAPRAALQTLHDPTVSMSGDTVVLTGVVPTDRLPSHPDLDQVRAFLPDSSEVEVVGHIRPLGSGRASLEIASLELAGLPVPERFYPDVLSRMGRRDEPGLSPNAVALRLPTGVSAARVEGGQLVLTP